MNSGKQPSDKYLSGESLSGQPLSRKLIWTKKFSKDVKRAKIRSQNLESLRRIIEILQSVGTLPGKYKPHPLKGKYSSYMECHIEHDWLLIWKEDKQAVYLTRTGTHSDLFD